MYLLTVLFYTRLDISYNCIRYVVHVYINGFYLSIIYVFMKTKSQQAFIDVHIQKINLDFKKAVHNVILEVFENYLISGCRFQIQNDKILYKHYMKKTYVY